MSHGEDGYSIDVPQNNLQKDASDPLLYEMVMANMIHGPCGLLNRNSPCMKEKVVANVTQLLSLKKLKEEKIII